MEVYEWMVEDSPQTEWIDGRGILVWLAEVFNGLGGGFYLVSLYFDSFAGMLASWLMVISLKGGLHFAYLGKPLRFWRMALKPQTSWLARGFIFLGLFICFGALQLISSFGWLGAGLETPFKIIAGTMAFLVVMNTGFVMNSVHAIPFWNSAILPPLFLLSGVLDGLALILIMGLLGGQVDMAAAETGSRWFLLICAFLITIYLWSATYMGPTGKRSVMDLVKGGRALVFWIGVILCGIMIPLGVSIAAYLIGQVSPAFLITGIACETAGAVSLKYCLLKGALYRSLVR